MAPEREGGREGESSGDSETTIMDDAMLVRQTNISMLLTLARSATTDTAGRAYMTRPPGLPPSPLTGAQYPADRERERLAVVAQSCTSSATTASHCDAPIVVVAQHPANQSMIEANRRSPCPSALLGLCTTGQDGK